MIGIYKITSPSGRIYIGQSTDIESRIKSYKYGYCKKQRRLYNSFLKYGYDNHFFEILIECEVNELNENERYFQEYFNVLSKNGLNCELTTTKNVRRVLSEESKKLISIKNSGEKNGMFGYRHTEDFKNDRRMYKHSDVAILKISKHSTRGNNNQAKQVVCLETGIYYDCIADAAEALNINYHRLKQWLNGRRRNKSLMIIL